MRLLQHVNVGVNGYMRSSELIIDQEQEQEQREIYSADKFPSQLLPMENRLSPESLQDNNSSGISSLHNSDEGRKKLLVQT